MNDMMRSTNGYDTALTSATALVAPLRDRAVETDRLTHLPEETIADLRSGGLLRLYNPVRYGGPGLSAAKIAQVLIQLGQGDVSVAWVVNILASGAFYVSKLFSDAVLDMIFSDPDVLIAGVLAPRRCAMRKVDGGYVIEDGMWGFNSGVHHAQWDLLGVALPGTDGGPGEPGFVIVPTTDVQKLNDWDTIAIRGSGSCSVTVKDLFVPDERVARAAPAFAGELTNRVSKEEPLFQQPISALQAKLALPAIGGALAAIDLFVAALPKRSIQYTPYTAQGDAAITHIQLGEATAKADAARTIVLRAIEGISDIKVPGILPPVAERTALRRDVGLAMKLAWEAVDLLAGAAGGSFALSSNPLNRVWRDVRVASNHATMVPTSVFELHGRVLLDKDLTGHIF